MTTHTPVDIKKEHRLAIRMAIYYLMKKNRTYKVVGEHFGMKSYEVSKYLNYYLPNASKFLNKHVRKKAELAKKNSINNLRNKK